MIVYQTSKLNYFSRRSFNFRQFYDRKRNDINKYFFRRRQRFFQTFNFFQYYNQNRNDKNKYFFRRRYYFFQSKKKTKRLNFSSIALNFTINAKTKFNELNHREIVRYLKIIANATFLSIIRRYHFIIIKIKFSNT